jgi:hypothetical protein
MRPTSEHALWMLRDKARITQAGQGLAETMIVEPNIEASLPRAACCPGSWCQTRALLPTATISPTSMRSPPVTVGYLPPPPARRPADTASRDPIDRGTSAG